MNESTTYDMEDVFLLTSNDNLDIPILGRQQIPFARQVFRLSIVSVGMVLNGIVLTVVACSRSLRFPRHVFWAAVSFVDCLYLAQCVVELVAIVNRDLLACRIFVLFAGFEYSTLLLFLLLAALDRYLAIVRHEWYKRKVNVRSVILLLVSAAILTLVVITSPFWTGYKSAGTCTINLTHMHYVFAWDLILGIICVTLHFKIFTKSTNVIRQHLANDSQQLTTMRFVRNSGKLSNSHGNVGADGSPTRGSRSRPPDNPTAVQTDGKAIAQCQVVSMSQGDAFETQCFRWIQPRSKVNRLEARAALNMSVNVLPFWLCTFPVSIHAIAMYWCAGPKADCNPVVYHMNSYLRDFFMFHSIYTPIVYMVTSSEFKRACLHSLWKLKRELFNCTSNN